MRFEYKYYTFFNLFYSFTDIFEDLISPVMAAQSTLHSSCKKRKDILPKAVQFIVGVITSNDATPSQKDGALHMVNIIFLLNSCRIIENYVNLNYSLAWSFG